MKKLLFTILSLVFLLNVVSAITVLPTSSSLDLNIGQVKSIFLNITNNKNYTVYNLTIEAPSGIKLKTLLEEIKAGNTTEIELEILKTSSGSFTDEIKFVSFTKVNCSDLGEQTHELDLQNDYYPSISICRNDRVAFTNLFDFTISGDIYQSGGAHFESFSIGTNTSYTTQPFPVNTNYYYECVYGLCFGNIGVKDESSLLHSVGDDIIFTLNSNVFFEETFLEIELSKDYFNITYDDYKTSYMIIKNTGSEVATNIYLSSDGWISFTSNNFNLNPNDEIAVNFVVSPYVISEGDTNKEYDKVIKAKADNSEEINQILKVFIPYANIGTGNETLSEFWISKKKFCDSFPTSTLCISEPVIIFKNKTIYDSPPANITVTQTRWDELIEGVLSGDEERTVLSNFVKQSGTDTQTLLGEQNGKISNIKDEVTDIKDNLKSLKILTIIIFSTLFFIMAMVFISTVGYKIYKIKSKETVQNY